MWSGTTDMPCVSAAAEEAEEPIAWTGCGLVLYSAIAASALA